MLNTPQRTGSFSKTSLTHLRDKPFSLCFSVPYDAIEDFIRFSVFRVSSVIMCYMKSHLSLLLTLLAASISPAKAMCWDEASSQYGIPSEVLRAIAKVESNFNPKAVRRPYIAGNMDGSYDVGLVQINSGHFPRLRREFGITESDLYDGCTNLKVGAWILADNVKRLGWNWDAIGAYNAGCGKISKERCAQLRNTYATKVYHALQNIRALPHSAEPEPNMIASTNPLRPIGPSGTQPSQRRVQPAMQVGRVSNFVAISVRSAGEGASGYYGDRL